ncbi:MAG: carbohydrate-binding protein [Algibacter sp.]
MKKEQHYKKKYKLSLIKKSFFILFFLFTGLSAVHAQKSFVHPGVTNKKSDLDRVKYMVEAQIDPWYSSYQEMTSDSKASYNYTVRGNQSFTELGRDDGTNYNAWNDDIRAAYYNAIQWYVTGDSRHAEKSVEIFNAWNNLQDVTSGGTRALSGAIAYIMIEAAEIIKSTYTGWSAIDIQAFKDMLVYPGYSNTVEPSGLGRTKGSFYWQAYQGDPVRHGNQGLAGFRAVMAMGIFMDNEIMYDRALRYIQGLDHKGNDIDYPTGKHTATSVSNIGDYEDTWNYTIDTSIPEIGFNEVMTNYIYVNGQCQESSRDQQHTVFGIGNLCAMAEMAWNQGDDLYSHANDRLLLGLEYTMKYNVSFLREGVYSDQLTHWIPEVGDNELSPFFPRFNAAQRVFAKMISPTHLGGFVEERPILEMPLAHYLGRGFKTSEEVKWTERGRDVAIEDSGLEAAGHQNGAIGWGALTSRRPAGCYGEPISGFDLNGLPDYNMNALPMTIEAENFDYSTVSGQGRIYNETTSSNNGGLYRTDEIVDIESLAGGGYNLTNIENGEWLTYTVNVPSDGTYDIDINYAAANANGAIKFSFNGVDITSDVSIPFGSPNSTGLTDWQGFKVANAVRLSKGVQSLKILFNGTDDAFKLNNFTVSLVEADEKETVLIQAEDYSAMNGIKTETTEDAGGGENVGYIDANDWMEYDINIINSGTFILNYRVASKNGGGTVEFLVDGVSQGITDINIANGWQNWTTLSTKVSLSAGSHTIRLNIPSGGWNINWLQLILDEADSLSQEEFDKNEDIRIYPNPVSNNVTVLMPISKFSQYAIFDISGRLNKQGVITSGIQKLNIDLSNFSKGVYLISLKGSKLTKTFKLIKN